MCWCELECKEYKDSSIQPQVATCHNCHAPWLQTDATSNNETHKYGAMDITLAPSAEEIIVIFANQFMFVLYEVTSWC